MATTGPAPPGVAGAIQAQPGKTRRRLAVEQVAEVAAADKKLKAITKELKTMVLASG